MRLSFSTRGWGDVPWDELVKTACEMGFSGIEAYDVLENERFCGKGGPFDPYQLKATARDLRGRGLQMPVFDTSIDISLPDGQADRVKQLVDMAAEMGRARSPRRAGALCEGTGRGPARRDERNLRRHRAPDRGP